MKKYLFFTLLVAMLSLNAYSQEQQKEKSQSKTIEFLSRDGSFFKKEFYDLQTIGSSYDKIECQVLIITDMKTNSKMGCLRMTTTYPSSGSNDSYIGTLDQDEIDACIMCLEKIQSDIITSAPNTYTEAEYKTRDGVSIGTFWRKQKSEWAIYVQTKSYTSRSMSSIKPEHISLLIKVLKDAKAMIVEKTK